VSSSDLLLDGFDRVRDLVHQVLEDLDEAALHYRPDSGANPIGWLVWHLTRVQDDHVAGVAGTSQAWLADGWQTRFGLDLAPEDIGYGHDSGQVARVRPSAEALLGYHDAVHDRTRTYVGALPDDAYGRVVDRNWDPPVTLAVRLVSVLSDDLQHVGQAAYVRGLALRRTDE
jgi:hypothetical protein